jgi:hypothetical protein
MAEDLATVLRTRRVRHPHASDVVSRPLKTFDRQRIGVLRGEKPLRLRTGDIGAPYERDEGPQSQNDPACSDSDVFVTHDASWMVIRQTLRNWSRGRDTALIEFGERPFESGERSVDAIRLSAPDRCSYP